MPALLPSELPVLCHTRQHWIVLLRLPKRHWAILVAVLAITAFVRPQPMLIVLVAAVSWFAFLRVQEWWAEQIILTSKRVIRVEGVVETTSIEASLRLDRISGSLFVVTVPGKCLGYGTIGLEAPGDHPGTRRLIRIKNAKEFYDQLRRLVYSGDGLADHDYYPRDYLTEPLPMLPPPNDRDQFGRR